MVDDARPLLDVRNLTVSFGERSRARPAQKPAARFRAVDDVSFSIPKGETVGLVGESGCGKTTLGRAIAGFRRVDSGTVLLEGSDSALIGGGDLRRQRRRMQMIFQNPFASLNPRMTVFDALAEAVKANDPRPKNGPAAIVALHLEQVGLDPALMRRFPHEFSGGQRQRIAIARALAVNPALVIADEPVSSLDVSVAAQILNLFRTLRDRLGLTMLFISHDLAVVRFISHTIMVMYRGRIVEQGPAEELFALPGHPYTSLLIKAVPEIPDSPSAVPFYQKIPRRSAADSRTLGCGFAPRCEFKEEQCIHETPPLRTFTEKADRVSACFRAGRIDLTRSLQCGRGNKFHNSPREISGI